MLGHARARSAHPARTRAWHRGDLHCGLLYGTLSRLLAIVALRAWAGGEPYRRLILVLTLLLLAAIDSWTSGGPLCRQIID
jgi:hypothetical protein